MYFRDIGSGKVCNRKVTGWEWRCSMPVHDFLLVFRSNYRVFQKSSPLKRLGIFSLCLGLFAWNFTNLLAIHFYVSANFCACILIFHRMAFIFPWVPIVFTVSSFEYWMQTLREKILCEKVIISSYTLTKGESWALLRKYAVKSTTLAQPFCVCMRSLSL